MTSQVSFITAFAAVVGCMEALRQVQQKARRQEHRTRRNHLVVHCVKSSAYSSLLEGRHVVLSGDKLYVDTGTEWDMPCGHPASCFYHPFPGTQFEGLVTTVCDDPTILNWVYVDRATYEVKFGTTPWAEKNFKVGRRHCDVANNTTCPGHRVDSEQGPMDATRQDRRLTLGGWEGFVAVQEGNFWAIYFDALGDRLASVVLEGTPVLEIALKRIETRVSKPAMPQQNGRADGNGAEPQKEDERRAGAGGEMSLDSPEVD